MSGYQIDGVYDERMRQKAALRAIARGEYNDLAGDPSKWASTIAYVALGGRYRDGVAIDRDRLLGG